MPNDKRAHDRCRLAPGEVRAARLAGPPRPARAGAGRYRRGRGCVGTAPRRRPMLGSDRLGEMGEQLAGRTRAARRRGGAPALGGRCELKTSTASTWPLPFRRSRFSHSASIETAHAAMRQRSPRKYERNVELWKVGGDALMQPGHELRLRGRAFLDSDHQVKVDQSAYCGWHRTCCIDLRRLMGIEALPAGNVRSSSIRCIATTGRQTEFKERGRADRQRRRRLGPIRHRCCPRLKRSAGGPA